MADQPIVRIIFCVQCAEDKPHTLTVDANNEIVAMDDRGHFVKFPAPKDLKELNRFVSDHKKANAETAVKAVAENKERARVESIVKGLK